MMFKYHQIEKQTLPGISLFDITAEVREFVAAAGLQEGQVTGALIRHPTSHPAKAFMSWHGTWYERHTPTLPGDSALAAHHNRHHDQ